MKISLSIKIKGLKKIKKAFKLEDITKLLTMEWDDILKVLKGI